MTELTFKADKTKTMADMWPMTVLHRKDGYWVQLKHEVVGPFTSKRETHEQMGLLQDKLTGFKEPENYIGIVFQQGKDKFYVDRWQTEDGPFATRELAQNHKDKLELELNPSK